MKKLSKPMEDMIKGAAFHEVRVNGEIVKSGYVIFGNTNTVVALMGRELVTAMTPEFHGLHWLTDDGLLIRAGLIYDNVSDADRAAEDARINAREAAIEADSARLTEDHPTESDMITDGETPAMDCYACQKPADMEVLFRNGTRLGLCESVMCREVAGDDGPVFFDVIGGYEIGRRAAEIDAETPAQYETNELPGDAERIWDAENAALEGADIRAEYEAEIAEESRHAAVVDELIAEIYADDRLMHLTPKGVFVSGNYVETMRRISQDHRIRADGFARSRQATIDAELDMFRIADMALAAGNMSFGEADRFKRHVRATCRPHIGPKVKPSSRRRNRR